MSTAAAVSERKSGRRFSQAQINKILREADKEPDAHVIRRHGIGNATFYRWRREAQAAASKTAKQQPKAPKVKSAKAAKTKSVKVKVPSRSLPELEGILKQALRVTRALKRQ